MKCISLLLCTIICTVSIVYSQGWIAQTSGVTSDLYSIFFVDVNTGWAVGMGGTTVTKTTDGGTTWVNIDVHKTIGVSCKSIYFVNSSTGWTVTDLGVYQTTDGGTTWVHQYTGYSTMWSIFFLNSTTGWAIGESGTALRTTDGGINWTKSIVGTSSDQWYSLYFVDNMIGWAGGWYGAIDKTTDGGATWTNQLFDFSGSYRSLFFLDNNTGWAVADGGKIKKTTDGGTNWTKQTSGTKVDLRSVFFLDSNTGWAVGGNAFISPYQVILHTTDGGTNWTSQSSGITNPLYSVYFVDNNTGWIVGGSGTILKTTTGGNPTSVQGNGNQPHAFILHQNYPNPFNPTTTIEYSLPKGDFVTLKVYNLLGQEVATLTNEFKPAGKYAVKFNAGFLASGIYIYTLRAGNLQKTHIMMLLK
jgi:photosystem II stability/assembly factor-like uncharacterized protein